MTARPPATTRWDTTPRHPLHWCPPPGERGPDQPPARALPTYASDSLTAESKFADAVKHAGLVREDAAHAMAHGEAKLAQFFHDPDQRLQIKAVLLSVGKSIVKLSRSSVALEQATIAFQRAQRLEAHALRSLVTTDVKVLDDTISHLRASLTSERLRSEDRYAEIMHLKAQAARRESSLSLLIDELREAEAVQTRMRTYIAGLQGELDERKCRISTLSSLIVDREAMLRVFRSELSGIEGHVEDVETGHGFTLASLHARLEAEQEKLAMEKSYSTRLRDESLHLKHLLHEAAEAHSATLLRLNTKHVELERLAVEKDASESSWREKVAAMQHASELHRLDAAAKETVWHEKETEGNQRLERQRTAAAEKEVELNGNAELERTDAAARESELKQRLIRTRIEASARDAELNMSLERQQHAADAREAEIKKRAEQQRLAAAEELAVVKRLLTSHRETAAQEAAAFQAALEQQRIQANAAEHELKERLKSLAETSRAEVEALTQDVKAAQTKCKLEARDYERLIKSEQDDKENVEGKLHVTLGKVKALQREVLALEDREREGVKREQELEHKLKELKVTHDELASKWTSKLFVERQKREKADAAHERDVEKLKKAWRKAAGVPAKGGARAKDVNNMLL